MTLFTGFKMANKHFQLIAFDPKTFYIVDYNGEKRSEVFKTPEEAKTEFKRLTNERTFWENKKRNFKTRQRFK
jgi:hypothetical protein